MHNNNRTTNNCTIKTNGEQQLQEVCVKQFGFDYLEFSCNVFSNL